MKVNLALWLIKCIALFDLKSSTFNVPLLNFTYRYLQILPTDLVAFATTGTLGIAPTN
jgi:hypothetical protein